ncbi:class E sortase [Streptomyces sp. NBC_01530]|uniref:class E sortase n=1 Tax=Streptomyces sp. NBC_01530 TaxID=2903895 RepID=UPI00386850EA
MRVPVVQRGGRLPVVQHRSRRRLARRRRVWWAGGEALVTVGLVLLLLVVHQLWWTNREARRGADRKVEALEREWGDGGAGNQTGNGGGDTAASAPPTPARPLDGTGTRDARTGRQTTTARQPRPTWSQAYAVLNIPRLALRVPVAEGVSKQNVLNKGYVGHYRGTGQPGQVGNFALAGHRNTHGEPFRYLNRLRAKDVVQVETRSATYTYAVDRTLPQTSARDAGVIRPIPRSVVKPRYGYGEPGYYITLTTCTPEYTSRYRLVVWGKLVSMRPR